MDPREKALFEEMHELVQENNKILHRLQRSARWSKFLRFVYWVIIIGTSVGAYYYLQPYIDKLMGVYSGMQSDLNNVKGVTSQASDLLNQLKLPK